MINPVKLLKLRSEAAQMQKKLQAKKIVAESRDGRIKLMMNGAQEIESLVIDESLVDDSTQKIINNGLREAYKEYQKKLQKEMVKDVDLDQLKKFLG
ncbi:YbaB/EbfC family nucleoid-associated protein [bacterium]|nr:YbaB/EbfC family nucleoid-associated protein [bacterium]